MFDQYYGEYVQFDILTSNLNRLFLAHSQYLYENLRNIDFVEKRGGRQT